MPQGAGFAVAPIFVDVGIAQHRTSQADPA